jgi:hypothetical protein
MCPNRVPLQALRSVNHVQNGSSSTSPQIYSWYSDERSCWRWFHGPSHHHTASLLVAMNSHSCSSLDKVSWNHKHSENHLKRCRTLTYRLILRDTWTNIRACERRHGLYRITAAYCMHTNWWHLKVISNHLRAEYEKCIALTYCGSFEIQTSPTSACKLVLLDSGLAFLALVDFYEINEFMTKY